MIVKNLIEQWRLENQNHNCDRDYLCAQCLLRERCITELTTALTKQHDAVCDIIQNYNTAPLQSDSELESLAALRMFRHIQKIVAIK